MRRNKRIVLLVFLIVLNLLFFIDFLVHVNYLEFFIFNKNVVNNLLVIFIFIAFAIYCFLVNFLSVDFLYKLTNKLCLSLLIAGAILALLKFILPAKIIFYFIEGIYLFILAIWCLLTLKLVFVKNYRILDFLKIMLFVLIFYILNI